MGEKLLDLLKNPLIYEALDAFRITCGKYLIILEDMGPDLKVKIQMPSKKDPTFNRLALFGFITICKIGKKRPGWHPMHFGIFLCELLAEVFAGKIWHLKKYVDLENYVVDYIVLNLHKEITVDHLKKITREKGEG